MSNSGPDRVVAFVQSEWDESQILYAEGVFADEVNAVSRCLGDHTVPTPERLGLQVFEGWLEVGTGDDPDVEWCGGWRMLTHWEMCRVRFGLAPWDEQERRVEVDHG